MIYGERIKQARELNGLTQKELAALIGCKQSAIAHFETNRSQPSAETLNDIGKVTGFLSSFFQRELQVDFSFGTLAYRSRRSVTKREEAQAYQYAFTMYEQAKALAPKFNLPPSRIPRITERPELSARVTRAALGIAPNRPISNLTHLFEQNGGFAFLAPFISQKLDAFSRWAEFDIERPMIIIAGGLTSDRIRYSIAHELGHLVMHSPAKGYKVTKLEKEANNFAAEFLMPKDIIKHDLTSPITLTSISRLKQKWGVSLQALIYRAYDLNLITDRQYHYLFSQLSAKGWRKREPKELDIPMEYPQAFNKIIELTYPTTDDYALEWNIEPIKARELMAFY